MGLLQVGAHIEQRIVPPANVLVGTRPLDQGTKLLVGHALRFWEKLVDEHGAHVRLYVNARNIGGKRRNDPGCRGGIAYPRQGANASTPVGSAPPYSAEQISAARFKARARRLSPCLPFIHHIGHGGGRKGIDGRKALHKSLPARQNARDLRLLEHHLGNPDGIWIACIAPRQILQARPLFADASDESGNGLIGYAGGFGLARLRTVCGTCGDFASRASQRPHRLQRGFQA